MTAVGRAIAAGALLSGVLSLGAQAAVATACPAPPARVTAGLPAPVLVAREGSRCAILAGRDGRVRSTSPPPRRQPIGETFPLTAPELTVISRRRRIIIATTDGGRVLWRSRQRYPQPGAVVLVTGVAASDGRIAFSVAETARDWSRSRLYVAAGSGPEHEVPGVRGESPVGWTIAGELVTQRPGRVLTLRAADGALRRRLAARAQAFDWDADSRTVVVARRGVLSRLGSGPARRLSSLGALGLRQPVWLEAIARGRVAVVGRRAIAIIQRDGRLWARAAFPRGGAIADQGSLRTSPDGRAVAFWYVRHRAGTTTVRLLRAGDRSAEPLLTTRFRFLANPAWSASLEWRDAWLLASTTAGVVVALRPGGPRVVLSRVGRALASGGRVVSARWSGR